MRTILLAAVLLSGCASIGANGESGADAPDLPAPIEGSREVTGSSDPVVLATGSPCSTPQAQCDRFPFTLNATAIVSASLEWTLPASDFDLYLLADGEPVSMEGTNVAPSTATTAIVSEELPAGAYEVVVVPFAVTQDTYLLRVDFLAP